MFLILLCIYLEVELLVCTVMLLRTFQLFSKVAVPFYITIRNIWGVLFPYVLFNIYYYLFYHGHPNGYDSLDLYFSND